jgi:hypothetical protein
MRRLIIAFHLEPVLSSGSNKHVLQDQRTYRIRVGVSHAFQSTSKMLARTSSIFTAQHTYMYTHSDIQHIAIPKNEAKPSASQSILNAPSSASYGTTNKIRSSPMRDLEEDVQACDTNVLRPNKYIAGR